MEKVKIAASAIKIVAEANVAAAMKVSTTAKVTAAVIGFLLAAKVLSITPEPILGHYSQKGSYFRIKRALANFYLRYLRKQRQLLPKYDPNSKVTSEYAFVATTEEEDLEKPRPLADDDNALDCVKVFGMDDLGNVVIARLSRRNDRSAEVWLYLRLQSGEEYQLPHQPSVRVCNVAPDVFSAAGLTFEVLEPMRRWQISYNGLLRSSIKSECSEDDVVDDVIHARFNFIWTPINAPHDSQRLMDHASLATSIATEKWTYDFLANKLRLPKNDWYGQWGQMIGSVTIENTETENLFLRGRKERRFGTCTLKSIHRYVNYEIYLKDGTTIHLKVLSYEAGLTHVVTGNVLYPTGVSERITKCNFNLHEFGELEFAPALTQLDIGTETKKLSVLASDKSGFVAYLGLDWDCKVLVRYVTIHSDNCSGYGVLELGYRNRSGCPIRRPASIPFIRDNLWDSVDYTLLSASLSHSRCCNSNLVGSRGLTLALLTSLVGEFEVPKGICVTTAAYREYMKSNEEIRSKIAKLEAIAGKRIDGDLHAACNELVEFLSTTEVPKIVKQSINATLESVFGNETSVIQLAIRSSVIEVPGEEVFAAGLNLTILGVQGSEQWWEALIRCWKSQFTFESVQYKRDNGMPLNGGMGVVFQQMIPADLAGDLFTLDPVTKNPGRMIITANYGLGKSVHSGNVDPDSIVIKRTWRNVLSVGEKSIGTKMFRINMNPIGGTDNVNVLPEMASQCCLSNEEILKWGHIGIVLENALGGQRRIEWAIIGGKDYLLQCQPISTLEPESDYMIAHELDGPVLAHNEIMTKAEVGLFGEIFPGTTSPLTQSTITLAMDLCYQKLVAKHQPKKIFPGYNYNFLSPFQGQIYRNVSQILVTGATENISKQTAASGFFLLERDFIDQDMCDFLVQRHGLTTYGDAWARLIPGLKEYICSPFARDYLEENSNFNADLIPIAADDSANMIYKNITENFHHLREALSLLHDISMTSSALAYVMFQVLTARLDLSGVDCRYFADVCSLLEIWTKQEEDVEKLIEVIGSEDWQSFRNMDEDEATNFLREHNGELGQMFLQYEWNYGHRCIKEFDFRTQIEETSTVRALLNSLRDDEPKEKEHGPDLTVGRLMDLMDTTITGFPRLLLKIIAGGAKKTIAKKESAKSMASLAVNVFRFAYQKLAKRMVSEGRVPDEDLVYFFTHNELGQLLRTRSPRLIGKGKRRRTLYDRMDEFIFPELSIGLPIPDLTTIEPVDMAARPLLFQLDGTSASPGIVKSRARVLKTIDDVPALDPGRNEIVITSVPNISSRINFLEIHGMVTEQGGLLSKDAVESRFYGIPAMVAANRATELFQTGDLVLLDGTSGTLKLMAHAPIVEEEIFEADFEQI